jgi:hypothetical protein
MGEATTPLRSISSYQAVTRYALWLLVAFFIALAIFAARNLRQGKHDLEHAVDAREWTEVTADISEAVHQLQREQNAAGS